jgi:protein O-GlcNAc transferase
MSTPKFTETNVRKPTGAAWRALLLGVVCASALPAQTAGAAAARKLLEQGARPQAVRMLDELVRKNPRDGEARLLLGIVRDEDGHPADALPLLTEAVRLLPSSAEAHNALGEAYNNLNALGQARGEFEKAVELDPAAPHIRVNLGMVLAQTGELTRAAEHLDDALKRYGNSPDAALAHYLRAKVHSELSEVEQASANLREAVRLRPDFAEAWSDLGQARKILQDDAGALAAFKRAVALSPNDPVALTRLGAEYLNQGQVKAAIAALDKAYRVEPNDQTTLNSLQTALRQDGQTARAREIKAKLVEVLRVRDVTSQNQLNATRINNEGTALEKSGDLRGAAEKYRQAVALDPRHTELRLNFAVALLKLGKWKEGLAELQEALRRDPYDARLKAVWDDAIQQAPPGSWTAPASTPAPRR